ncbi:hypothetical protein H112_01042 [Trichophyton rubrum D6]|uniref:Uncharacterized protein n=1 Tax=Trichophyton rubrum CBS 288.86 TaxID=1215330 RepID=A0A022WEG2_TRIRU|nr:hypothetical protein H100_01041 [Trichophyton rubrum MR850]EZF45924.1 hypothetical protein H102_01032 [Trichophyton rubrum CBS 100081]EZF56531.1 hypothetical protein H103_01040 [Trichophyton rubrum CBS 288.86]EZF67157.1 hypothetical protein H104_01025 [Trichophyton rubrum CBS 289.86]EZF88494.1 hypothetical protein H110_01042 [Trichophyton rubrum MR1448]EZG20775.1 hypothetical protein H107_01090 [Trichophyton rubrum CBS 202.88]KDB37637.1 hypothetical protein H112_01042 [Trichophyton rubrum 
MARCTRDAPQLVNCKWWKRGYCQRGDLCYFRHDPCLLGVDQKADVSTNPSDANATTQITNKPSQPGQAHGSAKEPERCSICLEVPKIYGLLTKCDHVFCLECIRRWRNPKKEDRSSGDSDSSYSGELSAIWGSKSKKSCPLCRKPSRYVIPSAIFPAPPVGTGDSKGTVENEAPSSNQSEPNGKSYATPNPLKTSIVKEYNRSMKRIPCRYFQTAVKNWKQELDEATEKKREAPPFRPGCYFGNKCHYAHIDPQAGQPYIFDAALIKEINRKRSRRKTQRRGWSDLDDYPVFFGDLEPDLEYAFLTAYLETGNDWEIGNNWDVLDDSD